MSVANHCEVTRVANRYEVMSVANHYEMPYAETAWDAKCCEALARTRLANRYEITSLANHPKEFFVVRAWTPSTRKKRLPETGGAPDSKQITPKRVCQGGAPRVTKKARLSKGLRW